MTLSLFLSFQLLEPHISVWPSFRGFSFICSFLWSVIYCIQLFICLKEPSCNIHHYNAKSGIMWFQNFIQLEKMISLWICGVLFSHGICLLHVIYIYVARMSLVHHCSFTEVHPVTNVYYTCYLYSTFQNTNYSAPLWHE